MQIQSRISLNNKEGRTNSFKGGGFYNSTAELESNVILSRALIDLAGCDVPWVIMANNKHERIERARRYAIVFILAFMSPIALLPLLNRVAMKNIVKLTKNFNSHNHRAIHISNEHLLNPQTMIKELKIIKTSDGPLEKFFYKLMGKKYVDKKLDVKELLENADGNEEKLRQKLIAAKNWVLCGDFLLSGVSLGSMGFINNYLTKKKTGQTGFSAELKMADKDIIEKRADSYEKNKNKRYAMFAALSLGIAAGLPLLAARGLKNPAKNVFTDFVKKHAHLLDYKSGIYMSRIAFMALMIMNHGGLLIASRNKTEAKDTAIRMGTGDVIFFGGDLLLASVFANLSDRLFKTKLRQDNQTSLFSQIFPKTKPIQKINEMVDKGALPLKNKKIANGLYWLNLAVLSACMGFVIPTVINKMIKKDVKTDADKQINPDNITSLTMINDNKVFQKVTA